MIGVEEREEGHEHTVRDDVSPAARRERRRHPGNKPPSAAASAATAVLPPRIPTAVSAASGSQCEDWRDNADVLSFSGMNELALGGLIGSLLADTGSEPGAANAR